MNETGINWSNKTANPMSGCIEKSTECAFCYAKTLAENKRGTLGFPNGFDLTFRPHRLKDMSTKRGQTVGDLIFMNSMSDPGLPEILAPIESIAGLSELCTRAGYVVQKGASYFDLIVARMRESPLNRYQMLSKRPEAILAYLLEKKLRLPSNVWMGATIGHQSTITRLDPLKEIGKLGPGLIFLSCEPLLGVLKGIDLRGVAWVIGGGESGGHATWPERMRERVESSTVHEAVRVSDPWVAWWKERHSGAEPTGAMHKQILAAAAKIERRFMARRDERGRWVPKTTAIDAARHLRDESAAAGAAFWWKQWGGSTPHAAGRTVDGREHNGMPVHVAGAMPPGYVHKIDLDVAPAKERRHLDVVQPKKQLGLDLEGGAS